MEDSSIVLNPIIKIAYDHLTGMWDVECGECLERDWSLAEDHAVEWAHEHGLCNCDGSV